MPRKRIRKIDWDWHWLIPEATLDKGEVTRFSWWRAKFLGIDFNLCWGGIWEIGLCFFGKGFSFDYRDMHFRRILEHYGDFWGATLCR